MSSSLEAALNATKSAMKKAFNDGVTPTLGSNYGVGDVQGWIPSGLPVVDYMLGGGLPLGRISEIFSLDEGDGKTTLLLHFAIQVQRAGGVVVWIESDTALDKDRASRMGADLSKIVLDAPPYIERGFEFIDTIMTNIRKQDDLKEVPILIAWDTASACPARCEKVEDSDRPGARGKAFWRGCRNLGVEFFSKNVHCCFVNQTIDKIGGSVFGPKYTTLGGKSVRAFATTRLELKRSGYVKEGSGKDANRVGIWSYLTVVKNKLALPYRSARIALLGQHGFDDLRTTLEFFGAIKPEGILEQAGAWYTVYGSDGEEHKFQGWDNLIEGLEEDDEARESVLEHMHAHLSGIWPMPEGRSRDERGWWSTDRSQPKQKKRKRKKKGKK